MPTTALKIKDKRLLFMTVAREDGRVDVDIFMADEQFLPIGKPSIGWCDKPEDVYHKELRQQAKEKGQLVTEYCTNPEWNPS
jgi:hypothetical protein